MKTIAGYEGRYSVTEDGKVWSHVTERFLKPLPTNCGYRRVALFGRERKIPKYLFIHRLVALTFLGEPPKEHNVNHKNGDKSDNHVDNLEWATRSENQKHAYRTGLIGYINSNKNGRLSGEGNGRAKLSEQDVRLIRDLAKTRRRGERLWEKFNITQVMFYNIVARRSWAHI